MAVAKMSFFGGSSITGHLLVIAKKTTTPLVEEDRMVYAPPVNNNLNIVFPDLDPVPHTIEFRQSPDGSALGILLTTFLYDVKNQILTGERRFYVVDGPGDTDPASGQAILADPYLDGKVLGGVFKEGFRYLVPGVEFNPYAGGGVELLSGFLWSQGEVAIVDINYLASVPTGTTGAEDTEYKLITEDTILNNTHRNCEMKIQSDNARVSITLEVITDAPEGTFWHFYTTGGNQKQVKFQTQIGNLIQFDNTNFTRLAIGQNESIKIRKRGTAYDVVDIPAGLSMVGQRFSSKFLNHPNTLPEDGRLINGDDYPRLYDWLKIYLPSTHKITTTDALLAGFTHPAGKEGCFILTSDSTRFKMPDTQGYYERGLKDFDTYGTDASRSYDYPGGTQPGQVGGHFHDTAVQNKNAPASSINPTYNRGIPKPVRVWVVNNTVDANQTSSTDINRINNGDYASENLTKNDGVIHLVRT